MLPEEKCLDECKLIKYNVYVSTTHLAKASMNIVSGLSEDLLGTNYAAFTVYYKSFDFTRIVYHGKVGNIRIGLIFVYIFFFF